LQLLRTSPHGSPGAFIATTPASRASWRLATAIVAVSVVVFITAVIFANVRLTPIPAFIPAYQSALALVDFLIAALLIAQFNRLRTRGLLMLAASYLFCMIMAIAHALSFPDAFAPGGLLTGGRQTTVWLYTFWHGGFPLGVLMYAFLSRSGRSYELSPAQARLAAFGTLALTVVVSFALILLTTSGMHLLPPMIGENSRSLLTQSGVSPALILFCVAAIVALYRKRITTELDLWLMVVMAVWICDIALSAVFNTSRYDLGFYVGRIFGLAAMSFLLCVLLIQANDLQNRLLSAAIKRSETYRQDSARLMEILDQAPVLVAIRDLNGRMLMANSLNAQWVTDYESSWRGKTVREIFGDGEFPEQHETLHEAVKTTGKSAQGRLLMPTKNGIRTLFCIKFPLLDDYDQLEAIGSVAIDITEQEKLSAAMERVFNSSVDLILVVNSNGDIIRVSPSLTPILGYTPDEWVGHNAIEFIHPDDLESTREEMRVARRGHRTRNFETRYVHKDGRSVTLSWTGVWSDETREHFYIGRDMTERQKLEMELRQSQKMDAIGQLTGGIAHDYNNLLTVILGNTEILAEMLKDKPEMHSLAQLALDAADRSATLTQRLLAFGRRQALEAEATDINSLLGDMTDLLIATIGEHVRIDLRRSPDLWTPVLDRGQFETAIVNLAVNARDAMPDGGTITIETKNVTLDEDYIALNPSAAPGDYIAVHISDTGTGMSQETLARVFEPFFTTKEVGKGTGLGLSMIYGFVKQSGGHITIYSEPGRGTVVRLYFPRRGVSASKAEPSPHNAQEIPTGSESILLVEDDPMVRTHTEKQLIALGYRVTTAEKGPAALELIEQGLRPDLLFTDIIMPDGMNGRQLADAVRKHMPDLKVLFTSGYTQGADVGGNGDEKGTGFLGKPFRRVELARKLREMLDA
jgi:PAS domain S-box-containing protein